MAESDPTERTRLAARIAKTEAMIEAIEDAITSLSAGAQTYMLDTGQTRQSVTKANIGSLRGLLGTLENRHATLRARLNGAAVHGRPAF